MSIINDLVIRTTASMSFEQREDFYLMLACNAEERGDTWEANEWLYHAEHHTSYHQLITIKTNT